jgi:hypothetical protein
MFNLHLKGDDMLILDYLKLAGPAGAALVALLLRLKALSPDVLGPLIDGALAEEASAVALENLTKLADVILPELANIAQFKFDPREHPSDVA